MTSTPHPERAERQGHGGCEGEQAARGGRISYGTSDRHKIPPHRHCIDAGHGQPRPPPGPRPEPVAGGGEEGRARDQEQREGGFVGDLRPERPGDGGNVGVELRHPQGRKPYCGGDIGDEETDQNQQVVQVRGGVEGFAGRQAVEDRPEEGGAAVGYIPRGILPGKYVCRQWRTARAHHMMKMMRSGEI